MVEILLILTKGGVVNASDMAEKPRQLPLVQSCGNCFLELVKFFVQILRFVFLF